MQTLNQLIEMADGFHAIGVRPSREEAQRQIALRINSPKRADAGRCVAMQHDESDCPLFGAADQGALL